MMNLLSIKKVVEKTGLSRAHIYQLVAKNKFPKQKQVTERRIAWLEHEVDAWIASL